tara:strand:+ start:90 stop:527 length:438 start_codon:yes stop_codon:yes gene_type:complete
MSLPKRKFREIVFQLTFSKDLNSGTDALLSCALLDQMKITKKNLREAFDQVAHIIEKQEEIDALISKGSKGYDFNRISIVERNILRLAVFELFFEKKLPFKVVISEAIRLTRKFGTPDSAAFVNAVLETIHQNKNRTQKLLLSSI